MVPKHIQGLSSTEAKKILSQVGPNLLPQQKPKSSLRIALSILKEPMITLLVVGGFVYFLIGDLKEAMLLIFMIGVVAFITYAQEKKTENALQKLKDLSSPQVKVIRDGIELVIPGENIVPGDIIKLNEGDRVPADCTLIDINNLSIDEAAVTGESLPVIKTDQNNQIFFGTLVSTGWGIAKVDKTGANSVVGQIGKNIENIGEHPTRIQIETNRIVLIFATIGLLVCLAVILIIGVKNHDWTQAILSGIAVAMSILPEEFPVVLTIFMALGALRISVHKVLARNLPTIETLGSATVLCVDKTGTLTQNRMTISHLLYEDKVIILDDDLTDLNGNKIVHSARLACAQSLSDPMELAIDELGTSLHLPQDKTLTLLNHYPFDSHLQVVANAYSKTNSSNTHFYLKGSPEVVASLCHLTPAVLKKIQTQIHSIAKNGVRLIAVATYVQSSTFRLDLPISHYNFKFQGLIGFSDPLRREAKSAIKLCLQAGIRVIMITGDHAETAKNIGLSLGLPGSDQVLTGPQIENLNSKELRHQLAATNICARIMPEQKLIIVNALKQNGEIVAMTGDGVNDAPALKAAHMGISMGLRGTDVARESSDMVLLNDNFASIVQAIREGRRIFDNIRKAVGFIVSVHVPIAFLALAPLLLGWPSILTPVHIIILELIIDPASTLVFESELAEKDIMNRPPRSTREKLFNRPLIIRSITLGIIVALAVMISYLLSFKLGFPLLEVKTMAFITLIICNTSLILTSRTTTGSLLDSLKVPNQALLWILSGVGFFICLVLSVPAFRSFMSLGEFNLFQLLLVIMFGGSTIILSESAKKVFFKYNLHES